jgi:FkbM family methyltransferase
MHHTPANRRHNAAIMPLCRLRYHVQMEMSLKQRTLQAIGHQSWLRGRDRILRFFSNPDTHKSQPFETDFFGIPYTGNMANFIDWTVFYYGGFAVNELRLLGALADALRAQGKPVNFYDVGANIGQHTLFMSRHADRIFSFEPFATVRQEMQRKLDYANIHNVSAFPVALGNRNETGVFHPPTGANQGTGTLGDMLPDNASAESIPVQVVRGDDFFAANSLPPISLLKMDVEGYEVNALEGLRETLWRDRPPILMEIQRETKSGAHTGKSASIQSLLYPDHLLFEVGDARGQYTLKPFSTGNTEEALVLPAELAGLIPGATSH